MITLPQETVEVSQWILFWKENAGNCYKPLKKFTPVIMKRNVYKEKRLSILFQRETLQEHVKVTNKCSFSSCQTETNTTRMSVVIITL